MGLYGTPRWIILNTIAATGGNDLVVNKEVAYLQGHYLGRYLDYQQRSSVKETAITSETAGVVTITPTVLTNSQTYTFTLNQTNPSAEGVTPSLVTKEISITTPASGTVTATTICDQFRNEYFSAGQTSFAVVASGTATLVITASAGSPVIWASYVNTGSGGLISANVVNTTAGIQTRGTGGSTGTLAALGAPVDELTASAYTLYTIVNNESNIDGTQRIRQPEQIYICLNEAGTQYAALITRMDLYFKSFPSGGTAIDPEITEIIGS